MLFPYLEVPKNAIYPVPVIVPGMSNAYEYHPFALTVGANAIERFTVPNKVPPAPPVVL